MYILNQLTELEVMTLTAKNTNFLDASVKDLFISEQGGRDHLPSAIEVHLFHLWGHRQAGPHRKVLRTKPRHESYCQRTLVGQSPGPLAEGIKKVGLKDAIECFRYSL